MPVTSPLQCPISLETPPQCPQITPCGHVFGFVPIMGYLLSHGDQHCARPAHARCALCPSLPESCVCFAPRPSGPPRCAIGATTRLSACRSAKAWHAEAVEHCCKHTASHTEQTGVAADTLTSCCRLATRSPCSCCRGLPTASCLSWLAAAPPAAPQQPSSLPQAALWGLSGPAQQDPA